MHIYGAEYVTFFDSPGMFICKIVQQVSTTYELLCLLKLQSTHNISNTDIL